MFITMRKSLTSRMLRNVHKFLLENVCICQKKVVILQQISAKTRMENITLHRSNIMSDLEAARELCVGTNAIDPRAMLKLLNALAKDIREDREMWEVREEQLREEILELKLERTQNNRSNLEPIYGPAPEHEIEEFFVDEEKAKFCKYKLSEFVRKTPSKKGFYTELARMLNIWYELKWAHSESFFGSENTFYEALDRMAGESQTINKESLKKARRRHQESTRKFELEDQKRQMNKEYEEYVEVA